MFTNQNTVNEILERLELTQYLGLFFPAEFLEMLSESEKKCSLKQLYEQKKMPWGLPFPSDLFLLSANQLCDMKENGLYQPMALWSVVDKTISLELNSSDKRCVSLMIRKDDSEQVKPAVLICPGGGYISSASYSEGVDIAETMAAAGYRPFILNYRVKPNHYPSANIDLALAIKYIRANAENFHIDPYNLMAIGSSAGGHLIGMGAANYRKYEKLLMDEIRIRNQELAAEYKGISVRPDKLCMNYPAISFMDMKKGIAFEEYNGTGEQNLRDISLEYQDLSGFPKTYLWICNDDDLIYPHTVINFAEKLKENGVDCLFHLYPDGNHGGGRSLGTSAEGWMDEMIEFMK